MKKQTINLFFACDDNYLPFFTVTLDSLKQNCDKTRKYQIFVLNNGLNTKNVENIKLNFEEESFKINFCDVSKELEEISERLHTRDYYSKSTYFRLFIPTMFPTLKKALYLDCDILLKGDVSKLYDINLSSNLVGAVHDAFVDTHQALQQYVENRIGVKPYNKYFNAGVLLMNLEQMRKYDFKNKFFELLKSVKFDVAQDQDYLNALCYKKVKFISQDWNFMPLEKRAPSKVNLIHFNLDYKPWHREGLLFEELFWMYANRSIFAKEINFAKQSFDKEKQVKAKEQTRKLVELCFSQANDKNENQKIQAIISKIKEENVWNLQNDLKLLTESMSMKDWDYSIEMLKTTQKA